MQPLAKQFRKCALSGIGALLLNSFYIVVDGLFVARLIGRDALAAVTVAVPVMEVLIALSLLISVGAGVVISGHRGRGDDLAARAVFNQSALLMGGASLIIAVFGVLLARPLGTALGGTQALLPDITAYLRLLLGFSPFFMFSYGLGAWARNDDRPLLALTAMGAGTALNIFLDYAFIAWCGWGVAGAALATGLGPVVSCAVLLPHFLRRRGALWFARTRIAFSAVKAIVTAGIPPFLMEFALGLTTLCVNLAVSAHLGGLGLAAYGVVGYVALIVLTLFLGMAEGTQPLFSYAHGRGDDSAVRYLLRASLVSSAAMGVAVYALLLACAQIPARVFAGNDVALLALSVPAIHMYFPALFASGMNIQLTSCLQSTGRALRSALVSALRALVLLSAMLMVLPALIGPNGVWLSVPAAELLTLPAALTLCYGKSGVFAQKRGAAGMAAPRLKGTA